MKKLIFTMFLIAAMLPLVAANWNTRNRGNPLGSIDTAGYVLTVDRAHQEIHDGHMYTWSMSATSSAGATTMDFSVTTGAKACNLMITSFSSVASTMAIWQGRVVTGGTYSAGIDVNRVSASTPQLSCMVSPSVAALTTTGVTLVANEYIPAGVKDKIRFTFRNDDEIVLKPSTTYFFQLQTLDGTSGTRFVRLGWYEK